MESITIILTIESCNCQIIFQLFEMFLSRVYIILIKLLYHFIM